jgi:hypothetical protein
VGGIFRKIILSRRPDWKKRKEKNIYKAIKLEQVIAQQQKESVLLFSFFF